MDEAIKAAAQTGDWVVVLLVVIIISAFATLGMFIRQVLREIESLRQFVTASLMSALSDSRSSIVENTSALKLFKEWCERTPPAEYCLWRRDKEEGSSHGSTRS